MRLIEDKKHDEKHLDHDGHEVAHSAPKDPADLTIEDGQNVFLDPGHLFHHVQDSYCLLYTSDAADE